MPRTARIAPGGMVFHVLNRANNRDRIFETAGDYLAFLRVLCDSLDKKPMRILSYCLMPNHWHLLLWPRKDGELGEFLQTVTTTHVRRWRLHRQSVGSGHLYQGTYKSFPVEADDHFYTRRPLRGTERAAGGPRRAGRRLAVGKSLATLSASRTRRLSAAPPVARPLATELDGAGQPAGNCGRTRCDADIGPTRPTVWIGSMATSRREATWTGIDVPFPRAT